MRYEYYCRYCEARRIVQHGIDEEPVVLCEAEHSHCTDVDFWKETCGEVMEKVIPSGVSFYTKGEGRTEKGKGRV